MGRRKPQKGGGVVSDIALKLLMESLPAVGKLLEKPASELGNYLGSKIKSLAGGGRKLAGGGAKLAGNGLYMAGDARKKKQSKHITMQSW
jgi:hypothetical protein